MNLILIDNEGRSHLRQVELVTIDENKNIDVDYLNKDGSTRRESLTWIGKGFTFSYSSNMAVYGPTLIISK